MTKNKKIMIGASILTIFGMWYLRSRRQNLRNPVESVESVPSAKSQRLFKKTKKYATKIELIRALHQTMPESSSPLLLSKSKELISNLDQLTHDLINPILLNLELKSLARRRKKIASLTGYIGEVLENLKMSESVTFLYLGQVLEDAGLPEKTYLDCYRLVVEKDPDFLNQLGAVNEKNRIMHSPLPQKYVYLREAVSFFERKISVLERIQKEKLFKEKINLSISQIGIILQSYISDLVGIELGVQEVDILRRTDLTSNPEVQKLQRVFLDKFLLFTQQIRTHDEDQGDTEVANQ